MNCASKLARYNLAKVIIKYFRQVDNTLYSFKNKEQLYQIGDEINRVMNLYNLRLQNKFTTNKNNHYDFENDHPSEVLLGYVWNKISDTLLPNVTISHGRQGKGIKGIELTDKPFSPATITKKNSSKCPSATVSPLRNFFGPTQNRTKNHI